MSQPKIVIKRIYAAPDKSDGVRILVDRLWPRGVAKAAAELDHWLKDVAPSPALRTWWNHDPARMTEFAARYEHELSDDEHQQAVDQIRELIHKHDKVTLLYAAKDERINHATVLQAYLLRHA